MAEHNYYNKYLLKNFINVAKSLSENWIKPDQILNKPDLATEPNRMVEHIYVNPIP